MGNVDTSSREMEDKNMAQQIYCLCSSRHQTKFDGFDRRISTLLGHFTLEKTLEEFLRF